jgi:hypothetical protein
LGAIPTLIFNSLARVPNPDITAADKSLIGLHIATRPGHFSAARPRQLTWPVSSIGR